MNRADCLRWAVREHGLKRSSALDDLRFVLETIDEESPLLHSNQFNGCLNSRDLYRVVKLVHVVEPLPTWTPQQAAVLVSRRTRAVMAVFQRLNARYGAAFDAALYLKTCEAIEAAGAWAWYPVIGFEFHPERGAFPEFSFYCEHLPGKAALAAAAAMAISERDRVERSSGELHALGLDFLADGTHRLKLYRSAPPGAGGALLKGLSAKVHPKGVLLLDKTGAAGRFDSPTKAYAPFPTAETGKVSACSGEEFVRLSRGRVQRFAKLVSPSLKGQHLFYIGASKEKVEIYFGQGLRSGRRA